LAQDANHWTLDSHVGQLAVGATRATLDLNRPDLGLQQILSDASAAGRVLAITSGDDRGQWPGKLVEAYIRGDDLVATYAGTDAWPYAPQIYWSAEALETGGRVFASLSLIVSIQTNLLDTHPRIVVGSSVRCAEVVSVSVVGDDLLVDSHGDGAQSFDPRTRACGLIWRLAGDELSYAEVMPTSDFRRVSIERAGGAIGSRWELFAEFLEKGVIRRARLQSMFVPREDDVQRVAECCQSIGQRPLPLTT
jgi:hypothetical protein